MSDGAILSGQQYDKRNNIVEPFTEQVKDYTKPLSGPQLTGSESVAATEITPMDAGAAKVRTWDAAAIATELAALVIKVVGKTTVNLPSVLTSLTMTYNKNVGVGEGSHPTANQAFIVTGAGSATTHIQSQAQASASIIPDIIPAITQYSGVLVPCTHVFMYMATPVTMVALLAKLSSAAVMNATVLDLPVFKSKIHTFILKGMQFSLHQSADTDVSFSFNDDVSHWSKSVQWGSDKSTDAGLSNKVVSVGPVLNAAITIGSSSDTITATVTVDANSAAVTGSVPISAITNEPTPHSATATGSVSPTSISATSPTAVPVTGLYLVELNPDIGEYGLAYIHAVIVDFTNYA